MALPNPNKSNVKVGLDNESINVLKSVGDAAKTAGSSLVKMGRDAEIGQKIKSGAGAVASATGAGVSRAVPAAALLVSQNPFFAKAVEDGMKGAFSGAKFLGGGVMKLAKMFRNPKEQVLVDTQKETADGVKQVAKGQSAQKGIFTEILKVMIQIRQDLDGMLGIQRDEKDTSRENKLFELEKQREAGRKSKQEQFKAASTVVAANDNSTNTINNNQNDGTLGKFGATFLGSFLGILSTKIFAALGVMWSVTKIVGRLMGLGVLKRFVTTLFGGIGKAISSTIGLGSISSLFGNLGVGILKKLGIVGIILTVGIALKDAVSKFLDTDGSLFSKLGAALTEFVASIVSSITFGLFDKESVTEIINDGLSLVKTAFGGIFTFLEDMVFGVIDWLDEKYQSALNLFTSSDTPASSKGRREARANRGNGDTVHKTTSASSPEVDEAIKRAAEEFGVNETHLRKIASLESGMDPNAANPRSSAKGLFQIIDSTARGIARLHPDKFEGPQNRFDPNVNARMGAALLADETSAFKSRFGRNPTASELQMINIFGRSTAHKLLSNRNTSVSAIASHQAVYDNRELVSGRTTNEVLAAIERKHNREYTEPVVVEKSDATARANMADKIGESALKTSNPSTPSTNIIDASVSNDNRSSSRTTVSSPAKSGSDESTFSEVNRMMK